MNTSQKSLVTAAGLTVGGFIFGAAAARASAINGLGGAIFNEMGGAIYATGSALTMEILTSNALLLTIGLIGLGLKRRRQNN